MSFSCADGAEGDVYSGILTADENGRDIWKDHPIDEAEGCTFATTDFSLGLGAGLTEETRNCDLSDLEIDIPICDSDEEFLPNVEAGVHCVGGTLDGQDSNGTVVTEE